MTRSRILVDASDTALQSVSEVLTDVRVIALRESSAVATDTSMGTSVVEVDNLIDQLLDILNTSVEGTHIFAGTNTDTAPFVRNGDTVLYQGNDEVYQSRTGPNSVMTVNMPGGGLRRLPERQPGRQRGPGAAPDAGDTSSAT